MTCREFAALIRSSARPVVLLEGRRSISTHDAERARATATRLANEFPTLRFRSGNAPGADQAFSDGVAAVDPARLEIVTPYRGHRARFRHPGTLTTSPDSLDRAQEEELAYHTIDASPHLRILIEKRAGHRALAAKAKYLIRDTLKVVGQTGAFPPPVAALFHVDPADPEAGGTGHAIRVCRNHGVPCAFQDSWGAWFA
jgi:hypothetical protein